MKILNKAVNNLATESPNKATYSPIRKGMKGLSGADAVMIKKAKAIVAKKLYGEDDEIYPKWDGDLPHEEK